MDVHGSDKGTGSQMVSTSEDGEGTQGTTETNRNRLLEIDVAIAIEKMNQALCRHPIGKFKDRGGITIRYCMDCGKELNSWRVVQEL